MSDHRLVIGPGGSGRTRALQEWVDHDANECSVITLTGSPLRPVDDTAMAAALADKPDILVVDDLQWCSDAALQLLADNLSTITLWASRRPWPRTPLLRLFDDAMTERRAAERLAPLSVDEIAGILGGRTGRVSSGELVADIYGATGGIPAFIDDAAASTWDGDLNAVPEALVDAIVRRIERAGVDATELVRVLAVDPELEMGDAARALPDGIDPDNAQRGIRAGGLVDTDGHLVPLVRSAALTDLTSSVRENIHDRLAAVLGVKSPDKADEHLLAGSAETPEAGLALLGSAVRLRSADPRRALDLLHQAEGTGVDSNDLLVVRAEALFHLGSPEAAVQVELLGTGGGERASLISYGLDVRDLRWSPASERPIEGELGQCLLGLAKVAQGQLGGVAPESPSTPLLELLARLTAGLADLASGQLSAALGALAISSDDFDRLQPDVPLGITPHLIAALASIQSGDLLAADDLLVLAQENQSGGLGERTSHQLLLAYARLLDGRYTDALEAVRAGEDESWGQRDRFLLAALDAALARRSGDTARLREAWRRVDPVLVRQSPSWLLLDPLTELLAAGARLGHLNRVDPVVEAVLAQCHGLPTVGPAPIGAAWLELQLALAVDDTEAVAAKAGAVAAMEGFDRRSIARVQAGRVWADIAAKRIDEDDVSDVARQLAAVGEPWEASRLVGQAALDHEDSLAARRLLELARTFVSEPADGGGEGGLTALGLSEREADVAKLVAEGRTHKEVGAQLYISPKTVEHHVAKIRQKLGATTRAELLATIREAVE